MIVAGSAPLRLAAMGVLLAAVIVGGALTLPEAASSVGLLQAADDPARLSTLRLASVATEQRIASEIDDAVSRGDGDLARSFLDLAAAQGSTVDADRRARGAALAVPPEGSPGAAFLDGATTGASDTWMGVAGSLSADLLGIGDVRDLWQEGGKLIQGEPYDTVILGLSTAGLALTGLTVAALVPSGGTSIVAKAPVTRGLSLLKGARRAGFLSRELIEKVGGMAVGALDKAALRQAVAGARAFDLPAVRSAAQRVLRPGAVRTISGMGQDVVALEARIGQRGTAQVLGIARNAGELGRARRLADAMGGRTRATLKLLGTAALVLGDVVGLLLQTVWLAVGWMVVAALAARRLGLTLGRMIWGPAPARRSAV
ncbi:hypothetical protein ASG52_19570 [Methylobacterium sp. Leaf456]|uniref:hypothetical protein n=1 Tax=Methylobacterium sp. Leaf456 TaxID=1736382 RepID=UPI0006FB6683|nr:hypothetical protein [Methylobacterium sp. Leaf456]KQT59930.1 hypothetical protein ASG52_19570 [Methylobacterium sp. Leaf456]